MHAAMDDADLELTVWFDADCAFCRRVAAWLQRQPKYLPLHCVAAQAAQGRGCLLTPAALLEQVTVTASDGAVYHGTNAWLICLWALRRYRPWSLRLASEAWRPWAERLFALVASFAARTKSFRSPIAEGSFAADERAGHAPQE